MSVEGRQLQYRTYMIKIERYDNVAGEEHAFYLRKLRRREYEEIINRQ